MSAFFLPSITSAGVILLADFETGGLTGWAVTGSAWTVGGTTGTSPNILPTDGALFARSGAPNVTDGDLAEANAGTVTSAAWQASFDTLTWFAAGWSGSLYDGSSFYQILDQSLTVVAQIETPQSDLWSVQSVNLISAGIAPGGVFYFRAVDGKATTGYSWLAFDKVELTGYAQVATPEPSTLLIVCFGIPALIARRFAVRNRPE